MLLLQNVRVFAGIQWDRQGNPVPTGTGRLCNWTPNPDYPADTFESFGAYQRTLTLECDEGEAGIIQWTPDANTPDTVYYQVKNTSSLFPVSNFLRCSSNDAV